jgi:dTDP-3,4-didehydro-2,6-dideoxy-alpha-D-glucose 3-reductase
MTRVAVWGIGPHASRKILPAIVECADVELAGLTTRNADVARTEAERFGCLVFVTPEEMLASADVDAVYLATPIGLHHAQGKAVLLAGKHLWCEKSLTVSLATTAELVTLSRERGLALCEAFMFVHHPQFDRLRAIVAASEIGPLVSITCRFGMEIQAKPGYRHSAELGGGALLDVACYPLALALRLGDGDPRVIAHRVHGREGYEVDLSGDALLEFPSGALAFLEWGYGRGYANEVTVWGERGTVRAPMVFSKTPEFVAMLERADVVGAKSVETLEPANAYTRMLSEFARATRDAALQERLRGEAERQARYLGMLESGDWRRRRTPS